MINFVLSNLLERTSYKLQILSSFLLYNYDNKIQHSVFPLIPQSKVNSTLPGHARTPRVLLEFMFGWPLFVCFLVIALYVLQTNVGWQLLLDNNHSYYIMWYVFRFPKFDIERASWISVVRINLDIYDV